MKKSSKVMKNNPIKLYKQATKWIKEAGNNVAEDPNNPSYNGLYASQVPDSYIDELLDTLGPAIVAGMSPMDIVRGYDAVARAKHWDRMENDPDYAVAVANAYPDFINHGNDPDFEFQGVDNPAANSFKGRLAEQILNPMAMHGMLNLPNDGAGKLFGMPTAPIPSKETLLYGPKNPKTGVRSGGLLEKVNKNRIMGDYLSGGKSLWLDEGSGLSFKQPFKNYWRFVTDPELKSVYSANGVFRPIRPLMRVGGYGLSGLGAYGSGVNAIEEFKNALDAFKDGQYLESGVNGMMGSLDSTAGVGLLTDMALHNPAMFSAISKFPGGLRIGGALSGLGASAFGLTTAMEPLVENTMQYVHGVPVLKQIEQRRQDIDNNTAQAMAQLKYDPQTGGLSPAYQQYLKNKSENAKGNERNLSMTDGSTGLWGEAMRHTFGQWNPMKVGVLPAAANIAGLNADAPTPNFISGLWRKWKQDAYMPSDSTVADNASKEYNDQLDRRAQTISNDDRHKLRWVPTRGGGAALVPEGSIAAYNARRQIAGDEPLATTEGTIMSPHQAGNGDFARKYGIPGYQRPENDVDHFQEYFNNPENMSY